MKFDVEIHRESFYNSEDIDIKHHELEADSLEEAEKEARKLAIRIEIRSSTRLVTAVKVTVKSDIKRTSNSGKQCIKVSFNRNCTPDVCGILTCEHAEGVETMSVIKHKLRKK